MTTSDRSSSAAPPLYGVVLAGGRATRLGRDKGTLRYHGMPQARWAFDLLQAHCERVWVSLRSDPAEPEAYQGLPLLFDLSGSPEGPVAGLVAAFRTCPAAAWLVLATDLPLVNSELLSKLTENRRPTAIATAFRHADGTPEPLCAIWEPGAARLFDELNPGGISLRRLLERPDAHVVDCPEPGRLRSVNTPADDAAASSWLRRPDDGST